MMDNIREYQEILLNILRSVIKACDKLGIPYFLTEGSCLGAIRHNGMIPWDDDIDIAIPSSYYEIFLKKVPGFLENKYEVVRGFEESDCTMVIDKSITIDCDIKPNLAYPWIDIMVLYGMPNNVVIRNLHYYHFVFLHKMYKLSAKNEIFRRDRGIILNIIVSLIRYLPAVKIINTSKILKRMKDVLMKYAYEDSEYVLGFTSWYHKKELMQKYIYGEGRKVVFEDFEAVVPYHYDTYLTRLYGDYMQLPPESELSGKHKLRIICRNNKELIYE